MNTPKGCADPDACACRDRIAELERRLEETNSAALTLMDKARADEREQCAQECERMRFASAVGAGKEFAAAIRARGDKP